MIIDLFTWVEFKTVISATAPFRKPKLLLETSCQKQKENEVLP